MKKYRVFYNRDCGKYGIEQYINTGYRLYTGNGKYTYIKKWKQIRIPGREEVYTRYKGVAQRWLRGLEA